MAGKAMAKDKRKTNRSSQRGAMAGLMKSVRGIFGIESKGDLITKNHLYNLIALMEIDGRIEEAEVRVLHGVASRHGITPSDLEIIMSERQAIRFIPPENDEQRFDQLYDIAYIIKIDGHVTDCEIETCRKVVTRLGYPSHKVESIVTTVIEYATTGGDLRQAINKVIQL